MTDKGTLKRIKKDAHDFTEGWGENCDIRSFIAGAKSERNKTIEEAIEIISSYRSLDRTQLKEILQSLKL